MKDRTALTIACLHISAVAYVLCGVFLLILPGLIQTSEAYGPGRALCLLLFCLVLAGIVELVAAGLKQRKFWAWLAGLLFSALYVPSLFLPLGVLGLWGLLSAGSRQAFGIGTSSRLVAAPTTKASHGHCGPTGERNGPEDWQRQLSLGLGSRTRN